MKFRSVVATCGLALALAGCSGGESDEPSASATPSAPSSSATTSEEPSPTFDPKDETAKQFIRRWIRLRNQMLNSGQTDALRAVTAAGCRDCQELLESREQVRADGGWVKTEGWRATAIHHDGGAQWSVLIHEEPFQWVESEDAPVETSDPAEWHLKFHIARDDKDAWVLADMTRVAS